MHPPALQLQPSGAERRSPRSERLDAYYAPRLQQQQQQQQQRATSEIPPPRLFRMTPRGRVQMEDD